MILKGRIISKGRAEGKVLKLEQPLSFLGGVEASTGDVKVENGGNVAGRVLVFPKGKGSTVGSFVMYDLKVHGKAPAAVVNAAAETIVATGAVISSIPMVDSVDVSLMRDGDVVSVDAESGTVDIRNVTVREVVSSVVLIGGKVLLLKRPDTCRSYPGRWSLVAGKIEDGETPEEAAVREIMEETQIKVSVPLGGTDIIYDREHDTVWKVHPFIFRADGAVPVLNSENVDYRLVTAEELEGMYLVTNTVKAVKDLLALL